MDSKQFSVAGAATTFTAMLEGETRRTVQIERNDHRGHPFVSLDPVSHEVAHQLQGMDDEAFLDMAIRQAIEEDLIGKAMRSHGPVVALLKH